MTTPKFKASRPGALGPPRRKRIALSQETLTREEFLNPEKKLPLVICATLKNLDLTQWAASNKELLANRLDEYGGILFRGFRVGGVKGFEDFIVAVADRCLEYKERSSPRSRVEGNIYTSTDYPAEQSIFLHNENSYQQTWPMKIFFYCVQPAQQGGETPLADCRKIYQRLDPAIKRRFADKQWAYVRNFGKGKGFGLDWRTVFQTSDKAGVQEYCRSKGIDVQWLGQDRLRIRSVRRAAAKHPRTGDAVWFNHATFFHVTTLDAETSRALLEEFEAEDIPANSTYGDGSPLEGPVLEQLREAYRQETVSFPWQKDDVLMLDNMMVAHGRFPYAGPRKVVVGMAEPWSWDQIES